MKWTVTSHCHRSCETPTTGGTNRTAEATPRLSAHQQRSSFPQATSLWKCTELTIWSGRARGNRLRLIGGVSSPGSAQWRVFWRRYSLLTIGKRCLRRSICQPRTEPVVGCRESAVTKLVGVPRTEQVAPLVLPKPPLCVCAHASVKRTEFYMDTMSASNLLCSGEGLQLHCLVSLNSFRAGCAFHAHCDVNLTRRDVKLRQLWN